MSGDTSPPDSALLTRYLSGDRRGADALFARYEEPLRAYLVRRLGRLDLAEEGLQETFCRLLQQAERLVRHPRLEAWLFSVARNVAVDVCRRRRVRAAAFSDLHPGRVEEGLEGPEAAGPDSRLESLELNAILLRAIAEMPGPEREVFLLRTQTGLSFRAIAARVEAPLNTVLSRMHRAMKRVRRILAREGWTERERSADRTAGRRGT